MRKNSKFTRRQGHRAQLAEALERRVMLASAIAAFAPQVTFGVGSQPRGVVTADVNLDGKPDLIVSNGAGNSVGVLLGTGSGGFGTQATFATGTTPFGLAVADVNRDGKPDLVVANNGSGNVSVLLGNGNGTFQGPQQYLAGSQARFVAVGDFNGDGKPDLVVANYGAGTVSVLLGNGNGSFAGQKTYSAGVQASSIAVGDFNRDGKLDFAIANKSAGTVSVLVGNGSGGFSAPSAFGAGALPFSVSSGDVNGDGQLDLVLAEETNGVVGVLLGNGNGTFGNQTTFGAGAVACAVVVGDVNGDGKLDIASANYSSNTVSVLLGNGNGSFAGQRTFGTGNKPFSLAAGDVNRDGRLDLVAGNFLDGTISVLSGDVPPYVVSINRSNPTTQTTSTSSATFAVSFSEAVTGVDATDFALALSGVTATTPVVVSGSGAAYQVTVNGISGSGTLGLNLVDDGSIKDAAGNPLGRGSAPVFQPQQTAAAGAAPAWMALGDLNGDGRIDVVTNDGGTVRPTSSTVDVLLGNGDGSFKARQTINVGVYPGSVAIADVNRDGKADLLVAIESTNALLGVLIGNGDGTFKPEQTFPVGKYPGTPVVGDFNGDGILDVAIANQSNVGVLLGNGDGAFQAQQTFNGNTAPGDMKLADVNGDGRADLLIANAAVPNAFPNGETTLLGNGNGTFSTSGTVGTGGQSGHEAVADLNRDGRVDVVVGDNGNASVGVLLGNGDATFQTVRTFFSASNLGGVVASDVNGDGIPDVAMADAGSSNYPNHTVSVLVGNGDGTLAAPATFAAGNGPRSVAVSDVNGDGVADLVVANYSDGTVGVLLGTVSGNFTGQTYTVAIPPVVTSITRSSPAVATTSASAVTYSVVFSQPVSGVDASAFRVQTTGGVTANGTVAVSGSGSTYAVTVNGIHGNGTLQLELVDRNTITNSGGLALGGTGYADGSYLGQTYSVIQQFPSLVSITRTGAVTTNGSSVSFAVTFSSPVTGVDAGDFTLALTGPVTASPQLVLTGSGGSYVVTVNGISGSGTVGLNFVDNGSIRDAAGNPLQSTAPVSFLPAKTYWVTNAQWMIGTADFNSDAKPDLVATASGTAVGSGDIALLLNNGDGTFAPQLTFPSGINPYPAAIGDIDGSGYPDIISTEFNSDTTWTLYEQIGLGNGTYLFNSEVRYPGFRYARSVALADVYGDGRLESLIAQRDDNQVVVLNNSNGNSYTVAAGVRPYCVTSADVNGDGKTDLLLANSATGAGVSLLLGNGDGTFKAQQTIGAGKALTVVTTADVNKDGKLDLLVGGTTVDSIGFAGVMLGNGNGTFGALTTYAAGTQPYSLVVTDVNGDGNWDLVTNGFGDSTVTVLPGNGDGTFGARQSMATPGSPTAVTAADLNGDGRTDLAVLSRDGHCISVMLNAGATTTGPTYNVVATNVGALDSSFGTYGRVITPFIGSSATDVGEAVAVQGNYGYLVAGKSSNTFGVARYHFDGSLDTGFGQNGVAYHEIGLFGLATSMAVQSDGKIVMAGYAQFNSLNKMTVLRLNVDGSLDTTFAGTGWRTLDVPGGGGDSTALGVAIQSDGRIVVSGTSNLSGSTGTYVATIARLNTDGSLDSNFGGSGIVTSSVGATDSKLAGMTIDNFGRIIAAGAWGSSMTALHLGVARFNSNGTIDTSFGYGGVNADPLGTPVGQGTSVGLTSNGAIIVAGYETVSTTGTDIAVARFLSTGALDTSFGFGGAVLIDTNNQTDYGLGLVVESSTGLIDVAGFTSVGSTNTTVMVRLQSNGAYDTNFNGTGRAVSTSGAFYGIIQTLQGYVLAGYVLTPSAVGQGQNFLLARVGSNGQFDTSFGGGAGYVTTDMLGPVLSTGKSMAIQSDGKIVVGGGLYVNQHQNEFLVTRYNPDGSLDSGFGTGGVVTTLFNTHNAAVESVAVQSDGAIVAGGFAYDASGNEGFAIVRYLPNGQPDPSFGSGGQVMVTVAGTSPNLYSITLQSDGKIVAAGDQSQQGILLMRFTTTGQLDTSFGGTGIVFNTLGGRSPSARAVATDAAGRIVVAGEMGSGFYSPMVARFDASGNLDPSFNAGGWAAVSMPDSGGANAVAIDEGGRVVVAGYGQPQPNNELMVARFNNDGTPDVGFGNSGVVRMNTSATDAASSVEVLADGSLMVAGASQNSLALWHLTSAGALDAAFGNGGTVTASFGDSNVSAQSLAIRTDGQVMVSGVDRANAGTVYNQMLAQFNGYVPDVVGGGAGNDVVTLRRDADQVHLDWTMAGRQWKIPLGDVNGLTVNGNAGNDVISLDYTNGNPLPGTLHLNGTFTVNGLQGTNPFSGTTIEIGKSTVYFGYSGSSPAAAIRAALAAGYNGGTWNGSGAGTSGAITSGAAAGSAGVYGVGWADSADGVVVGQPANTLEVRYTVMGDANLDRVVNSTDSISMARNYLIAGRTNWDQGNFNYDGQIDLNDAQILQKNYGVVVASGSVVAGTAEAVNAGAGGTVSTASGSDQNSLTVGPGNDVLGRSGHGKKPRRK